MENTLTSPLINREEAAQYLGVSVSTLARWAMHGEGPKFHKVGRRTRYKISDLDSFIDGKAVEPVTG